MLTDNKINAQCISRIDGSSDLLLHSLGKVDREERSIRVNEKGNIEYRLAKIVVAVYDTGQHRFTTDPSRSKHNVPCCDRPVSTLNIALLNRLMVGVIPANSSMHKALTFTLACIMLIGCRGATEERDTNLAPILPAKGDYLVPQKELPAHILILADTLEKLPSTSSNQEFRVALTSSGLNKEPDHYKDNGHFWYLDRDFKSETDPKKRFYRVAIGYWPRRDGGISFHWAVISREYSTEPWRENIWEIDWFDSSAKSAG